MDSGYWQVVTEEEEVQRLVLFTPDRKWQWKVIPMDTLNSAMMMKLQMESDTFAKERRLNVVASKIFVYDLLLYGRTSKQLLACFRTVFSVIKHHRATLKLKDQKWFSI